MKLVTAKQWEKQGDTWRLMSGWQCIT